MNILIINGGECHTRPPSQSYDMVIAVDSGYDHAINLGIPVDIVIGDFDSCVAPISSTIQRIEHPSEKDKTDFELGLEYAFSLAPKKLDIIGGEGGAFDHLIGNTLLFNHFHIGHTLVRWFIKSQNIYILEHDLSCQVEVGAMISLIPLTSKVIIAHSKGLKYELDDTMLKLGETRSLRNEAIDTSLEIAITEGRVMVVIAS